MNPIPRGVWIFALAIVIITTLPYLIGVANASPGGAFTGSVLKQTRLDYNSHLTKMQLGARGEWGDRTLFTAEQHTGVFTRPFYIALGHLARWTGVSLVVMYQLARAAATLAMILMIWLFVAHYFEDNRTRWMALLLATLAGGLGWLLYLVAPAQAADIAPVEFWMPEVFVLTGALVFPHFAAAVALLLGFFLFIARWLQTPNWRAVGWACALIIPISWLQPFLPLLTGLVVFVVVLWRLWQRQITYSQMFMMVPLAAAHLIGPIYHLLALQNDPIWQNVVEQNIAQSPAPVYYLLAYGWLLVPAIWGMRDKRSAVPLVWFLITAVLVYIPFQSQRRLVLGVQIPLAVLAAAGLEDLYRRWIERGGTLARWRFFFAIALLISTITHLLIFIPGMLALTPSERPELFFSADEAAALEFLNTLPAETVMLSAFTPASNIAAHTGRRVYVGHWIETPHYKAKRIRTSQFFDPGEMDDETRRTFLQDADIEYVWYDAYARALGAWSPGEATFLAPAFESETVTVYKVTP